VEASDLSTRKDYSEALKRSGNSLLGQAPLPIKETEPLITILIGDKET
jgi:hypothetical protein